MSKDEDNGDDEDEDDKYDDDDWKHLLVFFHNKLRNKTDNKNLW